MLMVRKKILASDKEAREPVFMIGSCSKLKIRKKNKASFDETGKVVPPKCKTCHVSISDPPSMRQIENFISFN